jgi:hypothetical protein
MPPTTAISDPAALLIAVIVGFVALAVVYALAIMARNEIYLHDLRIEVNQIRTRRIKEIRRLHGLDDPAFGAEPDVDIIEVGYEGEEHDNAAHAPQAKAA